MSSGSVLRLEVRVKITPCIIAIPHVVFEFTSTALQQLHRLRMGCSRNLFVLLTSSLFGVKTVTSAMAVRVGAVILFTALTGQGKISISKSI